MWYLYFKQKYVFCTSQRHISHINQVSKSSHTPSTGFEKTNKQTNNIYFLKIFMWILLFEIQKKNEKKHSAAEDSNRVSLGFQRGGLPLSHSASVQAGDCYCQFHDATVIAVWLVEHRGTCPIWPEITNGIFKFRFKNPLTGSPGIYQTYILV